MTPRRFDRPNSRIVRTAPQFPFDCPRRPLRFLLADDPGAGKTIMGWLLIEELALRGRPRPHVPARRGVAGETPASVRVPWERRAPSPASFSALRCVHAGGGAGAPKGLAGRGLPAAGGLR